MSHQEILSLLAAGHGVVNLHGCTGSHLAYVVACLALDATGRGPLLLLVPSEEQAREMARDLAFFLGGEEHSTPETSPVMHLPLVETSPYAEISFDRAALMQRMGVLFRLSQGFAGRVLVASAPSLRARTLAPVELARLCDLVMTGEEVDREDLVRRLLASGFNRARVVEDPGTFSVRGGILDIYPPLLRYPVRLEFFGDLVESIRLFDPASQRTLRPVQEVFLHPVRETLLTRGADLRRAVLAVADAVNHPSTRTRAVLDELESGREFFGIEALTPAFHQQMSPPTDYLPPAGEAAPWVLLDPESLWQILADEDAQSEAAYAARLEQGRLAFPPATFYVQASELQREVQGRRRVEVPLGSLAPAGAEVRCVASDHSDLAGELARARSKKGEVILGPLVARLRRFLEEGRPVQVACGSVGQVERLASLLRGYGIPLQVEHQAGHGADLLRDKAPTAGVQLWPGELERGFAIPGGLVVLAESEIFGPKVRKRPARHLPGPSPGSLRDLQEGDHVVHAEHGVSIYRGLVQLVLRGVPSDFLLLEFAAGDRLYLPVYRMSQVHRFVGGEGAKVQLDRLGGATWARKKGKVKTGVRMLAEELLQLYAQRSALLGHACAPGDAFYSEFEATFPFSETPDQERAIQEMQADLTSQRPMDRLVCGDVGFGKTEVALRAAFLVAMDGRQVAVLAPTTVLVEQHLRSFTDRLGHYPIRVEPVSRFSRPAELRRVLSDLARGAVDVVIGTHRLLSSDVRFKELGLLIIDEEQRFGVAHKERLKRLRTQVDVLTLSATPIPRTLQMTMVRMREISIIATPPEDRLSIRTFVVRHDDAMIAEAAQRELDRGGQVFFVHNRVQTIDEWARRIRELLPRAKVAVAHGQMDVRRLERVMMDFVMGKTDLLVCTAIIEAGLDIPRANTMFINRADHFGLAQLYQLRGRIGRSRHRAFCYLLVPGIESMSGEARQRLATLQRFTELGSGFAVATHDLEIRGAGDLLGARQSGHIAQVGFETYARILQEAVAELRGEPITRETDPELFTPIAAYIPDEYVEDTGQRLDLYRRLSQAALDEDRVRDLLAEIQDRYGPPPPEVSALGELMVVKGLASRLGISLVDLTERRLSLTLSEATPLSPEQLVQIASDRATGFRLTPEMRLLRTMTQAEQREPLPALQRILREMMLQIGTPR